MCVCSHKANIFSSSLSSSLSSFFNWQVVMCVCDHEGLITVSLKKMATYWHSFFPPICPFSTLSQISNVQRFPALIFQKWAAWQGTLSVGAEWENHMQWCVKASSSKRPLTDLFACAHIHIICVWFWCLVWQFSVSASEQLGYVALFFLTAPYPAAILYIYFISIYKTTLYSVIRITMRVMKTWHVDRECLNILKQDMHCILWSVCALVFL